MTFLLYIYIIYIIRVRVYGNTGVPAVPYFKKRIFKSFFLLLVIVIWSYTYIIYFMGSRRFYRSLSRHACGMGDPLTRIYIVIPIGVMWGFLFSYFPFFLYIIYIYIRVYGNTGVPAAPYFKKRIFKSFLFSQKIGKMGNCVYN
jgi:hypothetical protein